MESRIKGGVMKKLVVLAIVLIVVGCKKGEPGPAAGNKGAGTGTAPGLAPMPTLPLSQALTDKSVKEVSYNPKEALQGLKGVSLTLWGFLDPEARDAGVDPDTLKGELEEKLRASGIPVRSFEEVDQDADYAYLFMKMDIRRQKDRPVFIGVVDISAFQFVYLGRNPSLVVKSETWATHNPPFLAEEPSLNELSRKKALEALETFSKDYLAVNPAVMTK